MAAMTATRDNTWMMHCFRSIAIMMVIAGIFISMMVVFSCNFFTVSIDNSHQWIHSGGGFAHADSSNWLPGLSDTGGSSDITTASYYKVNIGLFRYSTVGTTPSSTTTTHPEESSSSSSVLDAFSYQGSSTSTTQCQSYDGDYDIEYLKLNNNEFTEDDSKHVAAQYFSLIAPIFGIFGCVFICFDMLCQRFGIAFWSAELAWFLSFIFQGLCFVLFREKQLCRNSNDDDDSGTYCKIAMGGWYCIIAMFLYFFALLILLLCAFPPWSSSSSIQPENHQQGNHHRGGGTTRSIKSGSTTRNINRDHQTTVMSSSNRRTYTSRSKSIHDDDEYDLEHGSPSSQQQQQNSMTMTEKFWIERGGRPPANRSASLSHQNKNKNAGAFSSSSWMKHGQPHEPPTRSVSLNIQDGGSISLIHQDEVSSYGSQECSVVSKIQRHNRRMNNRSRNGDGGATKRVSATEDNVTTSKKTKKRMEAMPENSFPSTSDSSPVEAGDNNVRDPPGVPAKVKCNKKQPREENAIVSPEKEPSQEKETQPSNRDDTALHENNSMDQQQTSLPSDPPCKEDNESLVPTSKNVESMDTSSHRMQEAVETHQLQDQVDDSDKEANDDVSPYDEQLYLQIMQTSTGEEEDGGGKDGAETCLQHEKDGSKTQNDDEDSEERKIIKNNFDSSSDEEGDGNSKMSHSGAGGQAILGNRVIDDQPVSEMPATSREDILGTPVVVVGNDNLLTRTTTSQSGLENNDEAESPIVNEATIEKVAEHVDNRVVEDVIKISDPEKAGTDKSEVPCEITVEKKATESAKDVAKRRKKLLERMKKTLHEARKNSSISSGDISSDKKVDEANLLQRLKTTLQEEKKNLDMPSGNVSPDKGNEEKMEEEDKAVKESNHPTDTDKAPATDDNVHGEKDEGTSQRRAAIPTRSDVSDHQKGNCRAKNEQTFKASTPGKKKNSNSTSTHESKSKSHITKKGKVKAQESPPGRRKASYSTNKNESKIKCHTCGSEPAFKGARFCTKCGVRLVKQDPGDPKAETVVSKAETVLGSKEHERFWAAIKSLTIEDTLEEEKKCGDTPPRSTTYYPCPPPRPYCPDDDDQEQHPDLTGPPASFKTLLQKFKALEKPTVKPDNENDASDEMDNPTIPPIRRRYGYPSLFQDIVDNESV